MIKKIHKKKLYYWLITNILCSASNNDHSSGESYILQTKIRLNVLRPWTLFLTTLTSCEMETSNSTVTGSDTFSTGRMNWLYLLNKRRNSLSSPLDDKQSAQTNAYRDKHTCRNRNLLQYAVHWVGHRNRLHSLYSGWRNINYREWGTYSITFGIGKVILYVYVYVYYM